jgi:concanavalin A-like lectin/glucanase superfamily protein
MLKLILDQDYRSAPPAVDTSPFANHGRCIAVDPVGNGVQAGSGALHFAQPDSAVRIAARPCWRGLTAFAIEAWINVEPTGTRRNVIEGDGSFTLYVDDDDALAGSVFAVVDGTASPNWHRVVSPPGSVPINQWCKVVFQHDGITQARLFIDDVLVAARADYQSGVGPVGGAGVVIGNWTLADQFTFAGFIDRVRFFKHQEDAAIHNFTARPISPEARDHWERIWECLRSTDDPELGAQLAQLGRAWEDLMRELMRAFHAADDAERELLLELIDVYRKNWLANTIDSQGHADAIIAMRDLILRLLGQSWLDRSEAIAATLRELYGDACVDPGKLKAVDPEFFSFVDNVGSAL